METTKIVSAIIQNAKSLKVIASILILFLPFLSLGQKLTGVKLHSFENEPSGEYSVTSFAATYAEGKVYLMWTAVEPSNEYVYRLERSNDNKTFKAVYEIKSAKSPVNIGLLNSFIDEEPLKGTSYYRVRRFTKEESMASSAFVVNVPEIQNESQWCIELKLPPIVLVN